MPNPVATFATSEGTFKAEIYLVSYRSPIRVDLAALVATTKELLLISRAVALAPLSLSPKGKPGRAHTPAPFFQDSMPVTASNFIALANEGYYNGMTFHRVIQK